VGESRLNNGKVRNVCDIEGETRRARVMAFAGTVVELYSVGLDESASLVLSNITDGYQRDVVKQVEFIMSGWT
jgi:hypothetical protein